MTEVERTITPGTVLGDISNALVRLHKATCGKGPEDAVASASGDTLTCVMRGGLTRADRTLVEHGDGDAVRAQRERLHRVMRDDARAIVERLAGRSVVSILYSCEPHDDIEALVFVLADAGPER